MIEVACPCGKTYRVPPGMTGRKIRCKRCGAIQRVPRPLLDDDDEGPLVVPFRMPGVDEGWGDDLLQPPSEPPLQLRAPLRRCPSCGTQDDAEVVLCVRCGFDWRLGRRRDDAHDHEEERSKAAAATEAARAIEGLRALAWAALTPVGVLLGPLALGRSLGIERRFPDGPSEEAAAALAQVRLFAIGGTVFWTLVLAGAIFAVKRSAGRSVGEAALCRARLERVGRVLRDRVEREGTFPQDGQFAAALEAAARAGEGGLRPDDLVCPAQRGLYPYGRRDGVRLSSGARPDHLLLWDLEPHPDLDGSPGYRALRFDGTVEHFSTARALEEAIERPPFALAGGTGGASGGGASGGGAASGGGSAASGGSMTRFLDFAAVWAEDDPGMQAVVEPQLFVEEVGVPPEELLPAALAARDPRLRLAAAQMLVRVPLPAREKRKLVRRLLEDEGPGVLLAAGLVLQQVGDPTWVPTLASVAEHGSAREAELARGVLARGAARSAETTRALLAQARSIREQTGARGDDAIFPLPPEALPHAARLLSDPELGREAAAVLYSADAEGADAALAVLGSGDPALRAAAFAVLDRLRVKGVVSLPEFLDALGREELPEVQGQALAGLADAPQPPERELVAWVLAALRRRPGGRLEAACRRIVRRVGVAAAGGPPHAEGLEWLLDDLLRPGDPGLLLEELGAEARSQEAALDRGLARRWKRIPEPSVRRRLVDLLERRPLPSSLEALLVAAEDRLLEVRRAALQALQSSEALRTPEVRAEVGRFLARRLAREREASVRELLVALSRGLLYCGVEDSAPGKHRCTPRLLRALEALARKGDIAAVRCLATHPDPAVPELLVRLLEEKRANLRLRGELAGALRSLTRLSTTSADAGVWRRELAEKAGAVREALRARARAEQRRIEGAVRQAEERLRTQRPGRG
ncbi:MAG: hypothetical protein D6731_08145 [Planctomycetota bacterium]|nr:MAG: hypothetical protein D6731_08145 [Planctomycetota bacterium]